MKIKNMLLASAALLISSVSMAQVSYGLKAGLNLNKSTYDEKPYVNYQTNLPSYFLTGYADIAFCNTFSVQPGISLQSKGDKYVFDGDGMDGKATWNVMTIEIPVNVVYTIPTGNVGDILVGAGPYAGISVAGKRKIEGTVTGLGSIGEHDMKFTGDQRDQNLIDAGANFSLGYKLKSGFLVQAEYGLGLTDLDPASSNNHFHNRTLRFGLGFQF
jgi:hypothetical protein